MPNKRTLALLVGITFLALLVPCSSRSLADYRNEKNLRLEPGGQFVIDTSVGSVTVTGASESGARVVITSNRDDLEELFEFHFDETPGRAEVRVRKRGMFSSGWSHNLRVHFDVRVPEDTSVEVKTSGGSVEASRLRREADLNTSGGSVKVSDLSASLRAHSSGGSIGLRQIAGNARVETSGGGIEAESIEGSLDARTSGGSIRADEVKGNLLAHTSGGSIHIQNAAGKVDAETSGGSVEVTLAKGNDRGGTVETSGGGVRVAIDPSVNLTLDASASGGSVKSDVPIQVSGTISGSHIHGTLGSGGETLRVHSSGGPVRIEAR